MPKYLNNTISIIVFLHLFFFVDNACGINLKLIETIPINDTQDNYIETISDINFSQDGSKFLISNGGGNNTIVIYNSNGSQLSTIDITHDDFDEKVNIICNNDSIGLNFNNKYFIQYPKVMLNDKVTSFNKVVSFLQFKDDTTIYALGSYVLKITRGVSLNQSNINKNITCFFKINIRNKSYEHFPLKPNGIYFPMSDKFGFNSNEILIPINSSFRDKEIDDTNKVILARYDFQGNYLNKHILLPEEYSKNRVNFSLNHTPDFNLLNDTLFFMLPFLNQIINNSTGYKFILQGLKSPVDSIPYLGNAKVAFNKYLTNRFNNFSIYQDSIFLVCFANRDENESNNKKVSYFLGVYNRYTLKKDILSLDEIPNIKLVKFDKSINRLMIINIENEKWTLRLYEINL